jgi:hypothetical protein
MNQERRQQIQERVEKQYAQLKENEAHNSMLRDPAIGGQAPRPSQQLIEASIGEIPQTDRQLIQQARDNIAGELKVERKLEARRRGLQNSLKTRDASNQNVPEGSSDQKEQKRQALRDKLKRDHERGRQQQRSI